MTQKERQARGKNAIFLAAMEEFGSHDYNAVTMDSICMNHSISKGMMYHYYSNKDDLFLLCVRDLFEALTKQLESEMPALDIQNPFEAVKQFFMIRERFFQQYPQRKNIFENAMLHPPRHLESDIHALRQPIHKLNRQFLSRVTGVMPLRQGLSTETVTRYMESIEYVFPSLLRQFRSEGKITDLHTMLGATEEILGMILFGLIPQPVTP